MAGVAAAARAGGRWGLGRVVAAVAAGGLGAGGATAFYYRPHPDETGVGLTPRPPLSSPTQLVDRAAAEEPYLMQWARFVTIALIAGVSRLYLLTLNDMRVREDGHYARLLELVEGRDKGRALITVSNHVSTLDDPALFAALVPWSINLRPHLVRWSICSQEICFKNDALATFFGAGKVMPIQRGGGVDQKLLQDFARRVAAGDWAHVFPEGRVAQTGKLEGRSLDRARALNGDRLKWGVGKLIARAPTPPVVIPIYHTGMQELLPIVHAERRMRSWIPRTGQRFAMVVGPPIAFDDLLEEHRRRCRSRLLLASSQGAEAAAVGGEAHETVAKAGWAATGREERRLYAAITRRIEGALRALEGEAAAFHWAAHGQAPPSFVDADAEAEARADAEKAEKEEKEEKEEEEARRRRKRPWRPWHRPLL